jgi:hypothetical protein
MMKTIYLTLGAVSALALAAPLAAQGWHGDRDGPSGSWKSDRPAISELRMQLNSGIARGTITRREATTLRIDLNALARLERNYGRDGFSRSERATLMRRGDGLERLIHRAESNMNPGMARTDDGREDGYAGTLGAGANPVHRGDRFSGDLRVGQHFTDRQIALPVRYRAYYRDDDRSFYRYDTNRVYQIDRGSGLILAMFDVAN